MERPDAQSTAPKRYQSQWLAVVFARKTSENHKKAACRRPLFSKVLVNQGLNLVAWGGIEPPTQGFSILLETLLYQASSRVQHLQNEIFLAGEFIRVCSKNQTFVEARSIASQASK
jgi:hypothetical protein